MDNSVKHGMYQLHYLDFEMGRPWIVCKSGFQIKTCENTLHMAKLSTSRGFTKGVSVDILYL